MIRSSLLSMSKLPTRRPASSPKRSPNRPDRAIVAGVAASSWCPAPPMSRGGPIERFAAASTRRSVILVVEPRCASQGPHDLRRRLLRRAGSRERRLDSRRVHHGRDLYRVRDQRATVEARRARGMAQDARLAAQHRLAGGDPPGRTEPSSCPGDARSPYQGALLLRRDDAMARTIRVIYVGDIPRVPSEAGDLGSDPLRCVPTGAV